MATSRICSIPDCGKPHRARGWCSTHYAWNRNHGAPKITRSDCSIEGCARKHKNHGLCATHAWRLKMHGSTDEPPKRVMPKHCAAEGCGGEHYSLGYCYRHYHKVRASGTTEPLKRRAGTLKEFIDLTLTAEAPQSCIIPPGYPSDDYHYFRHAGATYGAHRYVCLQTYGPAPPDRPDAAHGCGKKGCINRDHLRWATTLENMQDKLIHGTHLRGEQMYNAKLKQADVLLIRSGGVGSPAEAALRFGVAVGTIHSVLRRKSWRHI